VQTGLLVQSLSWLWGIFSFCLLSFSSIFIFKFILKSVPHIRIILVQFILKPFQ